MLIPKKGIPLSTINESARYLDRELMIVEQSDGRLRLIIGEREYIPSKHLEPNDKVLLHTHPTTTLPNPDLFRKDFDIKKAQRDYRVEANLDWAGRLTFFDHQNINLPNPNNILDSSGKKVVGSVFRR